jgi:hypothetical protein
MRMLIASSALSLLAGCVDYDVTEPTNVPAGDYMLESVNGARLPCCGDGGTQPHERIFLDSARLTIHPAGGWREWKYLRRTRTNLPTEQWRQEDLGTWTQDSTTRALTFVLSEVPTRRGSVSGRALTVYSINGAVQGVDFVYQR